MTFEKIKPLLIKGKIGLLPNYIGYFHWDYVKQAPYMKNGDYIKYNLDNELKRNDWFYII